MGKDALSWLSEAFHAVKDIGLLNTILIILAVGFIWRAPEILKEIRQIIETVLSHRRERLRIMNQAKATSERLAVALKAKKRKVPAASNLRP